MCRGRALDRSMTAIARPNNDTRDLVMRICAPDLEKMTTWTPPKAEKLNS